MNNKVSRQQQSTISSAVMSQITSGKLTMRPRRYYTILSLASILAIGLSGVCLSYLVGIVSFWARIQTATTPARGARANLASSLSSFPWWALMASAALMAFVVLLVRKQGRLYRHKTSTVVFVLTVSVLLAGIGLSYLGVGSWDHHPGGRPGTTVQQHGKPPHMK